MKDELIQFETAVLAKEKGFNEKCNFFFNAGSRWKLQEDNILRQCDEEDIIECPSQSLLQKWLREVHNIHVNCYPWYSPQIKDIAYSYTIGKKGEGTLINNDEEFKTYEQALEKGLEEGLKLIK